VRWPAIGKGTRDARDRNDADEMLSRPEVNPGDVWHIASQPRSENHFAAFPDDLVKRCLLASTKPGDEVLDPFVGRGTTVIVAKQLGRRAVGIELNPTYAALAEANIRKEASQEVMPT
jgi:DNA modification methylase